jgi:hypothetical protein
LGLDGYRHAVYDGGELLTIDGIKHLFGPKGGRHLHHICNNDTHTLAKSRHGTIEKGGKKRLHQEKLEKKETEIGFQKSTQRQNPK